MEIYSDFYQMFYHTSFLSSPLPSFSSSLLHLLLLISSSFLTLPLIILFHLPSFLFPLHPPSLFPFSLPSFHFPFPLVILSGMGWGFQAGGEVTDFILVLATAGTYVHSIYLSYSFSLSTHIHPSFSIPV